MIGLILAGSNPLSAQYLTPRIQLVACSPDGRYIAYSYNDDIWVRETAGGTPRNMTSSLNDLCELPVFTPDGSEVMFSRNIFREGEFPPKAPVMISTEAVNIETGQVRTILENGYLACYSRDKRYLVHIHYNSENYSNSEFTVFDMQKGEKKWSRKIFDTSAKAPYFYFMSSDFNQDNSHFVTTMYMNSKYCFFKVAVEDATPELMDLGGLYDTFDMPKYSPDGTKILYLRSIWGGANTVREVAVTDLQSGKTEKIGDTNHYNMGMGAWSQDGKKVFYIRYDTDVSTVYLYNLETKEQTFVLSEKNLVRTTAAELNPQTFALYDNFPNPFNPSTSIEFTLEKDGQTRIEIFSATGQKIRTLLSENMKRGRHSVIWDGRDDRGVAVSSGIYISRLHQGNRVAYDRMTLIR
jgi:WD40 repeat protein